MAHTQSPHQKDGQLSKPPCLYSCVKRQLVYGWGLTHTRSEYGQSIVWCFIYCQSHSDSFLLARYYKLVYLFNHLRRRKEAAPLPAPVPEACAAPWPILTGVNENYYGQSTEALRKWEMQCVPLLCCRCSWHFTLVKKLGKYPQCPKSK